MVDVLLAVAALRDDEGESIKERRELIADYTRDWFLLILYIFQ